MSPEPELVDSMFDDEVSYAQALEVMEALAAHARSKYEVDVSHPAQEKLADMLASAGEDPIELVCELCTAVLQLTAIIEEASMVGVITSFMGLHAVLERKARAEGTSHLFPHLRREVS
jgi:hypothetical protein